LVSAAPPVVSGSDSGGCGGAPLELAAAVASGLSHFEAGRARPAFGELRRAVELASTLGSRDGEGRDASGGGDGSAVAAGKGAASGDEFERSGEVRLSRPPLAIRVPHR
jgi:hypothetical protein